jgi:hypothetical protein
VKPSSLPSGFLARNTRSPHSLCRSHASLSPNLCQTSMHHMIAGWLTARRTFYTRSPSTIRPAFLSSFLSLTPSLQAVCPRGRRLPRCSRRDPPTLLPSLASRGASDAPSEVVLHEVYGHRRAAILQFLRECVVSRVNRRMDIRMVTGNVACPSHHGVLRSSAFHSRATE